MKFHKYLLATTMLAMPAAGAWAAQTASAPAADLVEEVIVSGSRITISGYQQPTPVTVVGPEILERDAKPSIGDLIRQIPAVTGGASPFTRGDVNIAAGTAGLDTINLRQLGTGRTLVLFDGQRVTQSVVTGQVDLSTVPSSLVQRVDVVTGGASAAWGSDAVSGVVNLVLNKTFNGISISADYGDTDRWDHKNYKIQGAYGTDFAGGKGHVVAAVNYVNSPEVVYAGERDWNRYRQLLPNPAYTATNNEPRWIHVDNTGFSQATTGGLIVGHVNPTTGATVTTGSPFRGIQFVGPNATPTPFNFGIVSGPICGNCSAEHLNAELDNLSIDFKSTTLFGLSTYEITNKIKASVQVNYGRALSQNGSVPNTAFGNLKIPADNAYLPASIKAQMQSLGITQIVMGTSHLNNLKNYTPQQFDWDAIRETVGATTAPLSRRLFRTVLSFDGDIDDGFYGQKWTWKAYYQRGRTHMYQTSTNNNITQNLANAIDAVVAPAGIPGIAAGSIICRATLTAPTNGCVPLDIFGEGVASEAAIRYVNVVKAGDNFQDQHFHQDVFSLAFNGELPFTLPAGSPALAFGVERRTEKGTTVTDGGAATKRFVAGNFGDFYGKYNVTEGFGEIDVPILKNTGVQSLSFNAAARVTNYSTSGTVNTWKTGLTSQIDDNIRIRGTLSRDIRAPNLNELFSSGVAATNSAVDPRTGQNVFIYQFTTGNTALTPEISNTKSVGIVLTPTFLPRFTTSLDFYDLKIKDAIASLNTTQTLQRCTAGEQVYCAALIYAGPPATPGGLPSLSQINLFPRNLTSQTARGLDFQADYSHELLDGNLTYRFLGNFIMKQTQTQLGVFQRCDGSMGVDGQCGSVPKLRATLSLTYDQGPASVTAQTRFIGKAKLAKYWTAKDVDKNEVPQIAYLDLRGSYNVNDSVQIFATIDNVMDQDPPNIPATAGSSSSGIYFSTPIRPETYDGLGRAYRIGVRAKF